jgi:hypothetical protein
MVHRLQPPYLLLEYTVHQLLLRRLVLRSKLVDQLLVTIIPDL